MEMPPMPDVRQFRDGWNFYDKAYADALASWERVAKRLIEAAHNAAPEPSTQETRS
jgi:hypothetical protein